MPGTELRDLLQRGAGLPPDALDVQAAWQRGRRRRTVTRLSAVGAVAAVVVTALMLQPFTGDLTPDISIEPAEPSTTDETTDAEEPPAGTSQSDELENEDGEATESDEPSNHADKQTVDVYFTVWSQSGEAEVAAVQRTVSSPEVLTGALESLVEGPTEQEQQEGYSSWFSPETSEMVTSVTIEDKTAYVDFDADMPEVIPNASTSTGALTLLAELDETVTQFDTVEDAVYSLDGDIEAFYTWLQMTAPDP